MFWVCGLLLLNTINISKNMPTKGLLHIAPTNAPQQYFELNDGWADHHMYNEYSLPGEVVIPPIHIVDDIMK